MSFLEYLDSYPKAPGVYLMKGAEGKILYVGKAKNLRSRIKQYFSKGRDSRGMIPYLTTQVIDIKTIIVDSEKEALLLENNLIKQHKPKYNALLKDDKTYFSLKVNHKHKWPMIRVVRFKGRAPKDALYFGPYTKAHAAREMLELLRNLFPMRQCSDNELISRTRPCMLYELKRCIAPCVGKCTKEEYDTLVKRVILFLRGHTSAVLKELKEELNQAVEQLAFEKADRIHKTIQAIVATMEKQKVEQATGTDKDVIGIYREGESVVVTQLLFREGKLIASNAHLFKHNAQDDVELLSSFIMQAYASQKDLPEEIVIPFALPDQDSLLSLVAKEKRCFFTVPKKGDKKGLIEMAVINGKAKLEFEVTAKKQQEQILVSLEEVLKLTHYPEKIECFDHSNFSGTEPVSAMVVFVEGKKENKLYRKYKIKTAKPSDDYGALREVLTRRYTKAKEEDDLPDLIVIDGGKGHLNLALDVLSELDISTCDLVAIAKEEHKHTKGITNERVFIPASNLPITFSPQSKELLFLQQIRDEAHRFAISFQRKRLTKKSLQSSIDALPGIGPIKKNRLLKAFGSIKRICNAADNELLQVKGITRKDIETLRKLYSRLNFK